MMGVEPESLTVSVREGAVAIDGEFYDYQAAPGEQVTLTGGSLNVLSINRHGEYWTGWPWTSPPVNVDGLVLHEFLTWACLGMASTGIRARPTIAGRNAIRRHHRYRTGLRRRCRASPAAALAWRIDDAGVIHVSENP